MQFATFFSRRDCPNVLLDLSTERLSLLERVLEDMENSSLHYFIGGA